MEARKFNPKIGHGFSNDKFGEGSVLVKIEAEGLAAITQNLQVGSTILLKYNKVTTKGNKHYFVEILPPLVDDPRSAGKAKAKKTSYSDLD